MRDIELHGFSIAEQGPAALRPFLTTLFEAERWEAVRGRFAVIVAVLGLPCWLMAMWPHLNIDEGLREVLLGAWALPFGFFIASAVYARRWRGRCDGYEATRGEQRRSNRGQVGRLAHDENPVGGPPRGNTPESPTPRS